MTIPSQDQIDWASPKPEEHLAWAMRNLPTFAGVGTVTNEGFLKQWSEHLVKTGVVHVDYLRTLADENGLIHVDQLPTQEIKWQAPMRGPRHGFNNAARWVPVDAPTPEPMRIQDPATLTNQERGALVDELRRLGAIPAEKPPQHQAQELN